MEDKATFIWCEQAELKILQPEAQNLSLGKILKPWPNGLASQRKFDSTYLRGLAWTCINLYLHRL